MTLLYYDCFSGISGDMNLGAMVDLGVDPEYLKSELGKLRLDNFSIEFTKDQRKGITGTRAHVMIRDNEDNVVTGHDGIHHKPHEDHEHHDQSEHHDRHDHPVRDEHPDHSGHRNLEDIRSIILQSGLNDFVKTKSLEIFQRVAEAEAKIHNKSIDEIHFHEVGAIDSIVDIVGAAICFNYLKPDRIISSSVEVGGGFVKCEHGIFPVPAPATAEILKNIPIKSGAVQSEATTPTGAAILATMVSEFTDTLHFTIQKTGYGIGTKDFNIPNALRVHLGELSVQPVSDEEIQQSSMIECNIDDMNPEMYGYIMDLLFEKGADDVFITPIIMKKARPASKLSVLCSNETGHEIIDILLTQTTSLGVRIHKVDKIALKREFSKIMTRFGPVTIKTAIYQGKKLKSKPEYEDCIRIARENNIPVHQVYQEIASNIPNT